MLSVEQLIQEALSLPNATRAFLVEKLIESLESDTDKNIQNSWNIEAKNRRDEIRNHAVEPISGKVGLAQEQIENRRVEILVNAQEVMQAFKDGTAKRGSVDDLIADLF